MDRKECEELLAEISNQKLNCVQDLIACKQEYFRLRVWYEVILRYSRAAIGAWSEALTKGMELSEEELKERALLRAIDEVASEKDRLLKDFEEFLPRWRSTETPAEAFDLAIAELRRKARGEGGLLA